MKITTGSESLTEIRRLIDGRDITLERLLGRDAVPRFKQLAIRLCERTPALLECTPLSVAGAILEAAELKLPLGTHLGYAWLVPYKDRRRGITRAVFIPGYRGLVELARRSGRVQHVWADCVRYGDVFEEHRGSKPRIVHEPVEIQHRDKTYLENEQIMGVYACARLTTKLVIPLVLPIETVLATQRRSPAGRSGPWVTDFPAMAMKTAVRRLCPSLPLSPEDQRVVSRDEAFDEGREPDLTEAEWEEQKPGPETTALGIEDLEPEVPPTISEKTLMAIMRAADENDLTESQVAEACDAVAGTLIPMTMNEEEGKKVLQRIADMVK